ncbi:IS3 family transposase [Streptomyces collinus]|uniref:IS3 family transposase n=1 Tax=Streptomyces collinus TaxID=42684 RepID=UPI0036B4E330
MRTAAPRRRNDRADQGDPYGIRWRLGLTARDAVLKRDGVHVGRKRVERLMREADIAGVNPKRKGFTRRDPKATSAPDLVERDFTAKAPNRLWVTDLTMIPTGEGPLWLSVIRDASSRRVVASETSAQAEADVVLTTL